MTTLGAIGFNLAAGLGLGLVALTGFGVAVWNRCEYVAPRCTARPKNVIFCPEMVGTKTVADRGNPFWGWIPWTLGLSYDTLLNGVPGTGTREGGKSGWLLRANMDAVVLLRFHALCLKVCGVGTVLFLLVLLPMYFTAGCYENVADSAEWQAACGRTNLTNYERTTIANVPSFSIQQQSDQNRLVWVVNSNDSKSAVRLYFAVIAFWVIQFYLLHLLKREWVEILAMRRVYYLEADVWGERKQELSGINLHSSNNRQDSRSRLFNKGNFMDSDEMRREVRNPWIPHPEHRDTVPNVQLYSVLVGGLPSLPQQEDEDASVTNLGWQLDMTAAFFDRCVPNQPGFSCSVAAVTILPSSQLVRTAWSKWYVAAKKLRRLRFIRALIARKMLLEQEEELVVPMVPPPPSPSADSSSLDTNAVDVQPVSPPTESVVENENKPKENEQESSKKKVEPESVLSSEHTGNDYHDTVEEHVVDTLDVFGDQSHDQKPAATSTVIESASKVPLNSDAQFQEFYENLFIGQGPEIVPVPSGRENADDASELTDVKQVTQEELLMQKFGPEQLDVYSREFALASTCCPNGCGERRVINSSLEELRQMESKVANEVLMASKELWRVQQEARHLPVPPTSPVHPNSPVEAQENKNDDEDLPVQVQSSRSDGDRGGETDDQLSLEPVQDVEAGLSTIELRLMEPSEFRNRRKVRPRLPSDMRLEEHIYNLGSKHEQKVDSEREEKDSGLYVDPLSSRRKILSQWDKVTTIVSSMRKEKPGKKETPMSGIWRVPIFHNLVDKMVDRAKVMTKQTAEVINLQRESTYAVVTFTSRQAAVAARQCLADARAVERWMLTTELPIPPLADAAACDVLACRNCCRPVTLSIDVRQKTMRFYIVMVILLLFYVFTPFVLSFFTSLLVPQNLVVALPGFFHWLQEVFGEGVASTISGFLQATLYALFFTFLPMIFLALANFGSNAHSVATSELNALQYLWWYTVVSVFSGTLIANMVIGGFSQGLQEGDLKSVLLGIAQTIPSTQAAVWLNTIVLRTTYTWTAQYLLQMNAFLFAFLGLKCCTRLSLGGGAGPPTPYRLYVDSSTVLLCLFALAPCSPLVAPATFCYFLVAQPVLRWCMIFVHRPNFDSGGLRWPSLFLFSISALLVGEILLTTQMILKQAAGPAIMAALPFLYTILQYNDMKKRFHRPFYDAALLQTSLLDGWDTQKVTSMKRREDFRKFLVDSHKAAFVPVCLAGTDNQENSFTAYPAVVVPLETDNEEDFLLEEMASSLELGESFAIDASFRRKQSRSLLVKENSTRQFGAVLRRPMNSSPSIRQQSKLGAWRFS